MMPDSFEYLSYMDSIGINPAEGLFCRCSVTPIKRVIKVLNLSVFSSNPNEDILHRQ